MADVQYGPEAGHYTHESDFDPSAFQTATGSNALKTLTHLTGAALSLALLVGVSVWGYKLVARDVTGIPVVRAAQGEMRVRPADPGGQLAQNTGLAVNEVAALGTAAAPSDTLTLAPPATDLAETDAGPAPAPVAEPQQQEVAAPAPAASQSVADLVAALTEGVPTIEADETPAVPVVTATTAPIEAPQPVVPETSVQPAVLSGPGLNLSLRPQVRPARAPAAASVATAVAAVPAPAPQEIDPASLPSGTRLAQLGAYESAAVARSEWERFQTRFGPQLAGKDRVVQRAQSGGKTFYRLRAHGFEDLAAARRFCATLSAEGQDCIPVVTR